jgi:pimeloyl-ACP methyl ester carboxylesterase
VKIIHKTIGLGLNLASLVAPDWATNWAIRTFALPPKPNIRDKERAFLATAKQLRTLRNGHDIVEYHWGNPDAPLVVMSYGWGYNAGRWRHFVGILLDAGYRIIAYDPCGHGLAPRKDLDLPTNASFIEGIIKDNGRAEVILAHSFGGASSVYAVHNLPIQLHPKKLIIMASFSNTPNVFKAYGNALGLWKLPYQRMVATFEKRIGKPLRYFDMAFIASQFAHIQGLIVHSPSDKVTPVASSLRYHSFWAGSYLYSPKDGGHHLGTEQITAAILSFILENKAPDGAELQDKPVNTKHDMVRYFAGI